ncbi:MAG TPA: Hsp20/alpha crystallin family protein [Syntrophus sp. (in: bacteria)]|jgi:HSP20 family protein|nr:Hsp20/alpha crystallin family protein [Syntrophus sp. (in: bacteria)]
MNSSGLWRTGNIVDLFPEMQRLQRDMNRLFTGIPRAVGQENPAINVWSGENDYIVTAELAGIDPHKLDISVKGDGLTFSGNHGVEPLKEGETYHRQERASGRFSRTVQLPFQIDSEKVTAKYEKGVLRMTLPRLKSDKPRKISIKAE